MYKWGLVVCKKEMTKIRDNGKFIPVTMVSLVDQKVKRLKKKEKDWYNALVISYGKNNKWLYKKEVEVKICDKDMNLYNSDDILSFDVMWDSEFVSIEWKSKWKWYQWVMKRFHTKWWPKTHGSKFHRQVWSLWNRKPRRVQMWHPHAWHMWSEKITIKNIKVMWILDSDTTESVLLLKWSLPGSYNWYLKLMFK